MDGSTVVKAFVAHLRAHGHPDLKIDQCPDVTNRTSPDIDAIAGSLAIEHSSIDSVPNQRRDSAWFMRAAGGLEDEISPLSFRATIGLDYDAVRKGQNWVTVRAALKHWITTVLPLLSDGEHVIRDTEIAGVPFNLRIRKAASDRPRLVFLRLEPSSDILSSRIKEQLDRKIAKLQRYRGAEKTTIVLVESADLGLMDQLKMCDAIQSAYPNGVPRAVDQIWFADTSDPTSIEFMEFSSCLHRKGP